MKNWARFNRESNAQTISQMWMASVPRLSCLGKTTQGNRATVHPMWCIEKLSKVNRESKAQTISQMSMGIRATVILSGKNTLG